MKKTTTIIKSFLYRMGVAIGVAALFFGVHNAANATQTVRELWDAPGGMKVPLDGRGSDPTTVGLDASTNWMVYPPGNTGLIQDGTWDLSDWMVGFGDTSLPATLGSSGTMEFNGGNMSTLTNPATSLPYGDYYSQCYATRAMTTNAYINFQSNGTYYFSVRMWKDLPSWSWPGDCGGGVGFASSGAANAHFVGAGITRKSPFYAADGVTDIGDSDYITTGTLDQTGLAGHPDDSGGPYYPRAAGSGGLISGGGFLVGQLTTTTSGASTLNVKFYRSNTDTIDTDPGAITWDATYSFTETNVMTHLLVWQYGTGPSVQDALRVGTAYSDVIGLELYGAPTVSPASTVYAGTTMTLWANAGLNNGTFPMSFQWRSNSVDILDATNYYLTLTSPTTNFTADYSVVVNNYYGTLTNVLHVTVNPAVSPFFVAGGKPVSTTRYLGAPAASFTATVNGTPPFTYQWKHAGTNIQSAVTTSDSANTLTVGPVTLADAGDYSVTVTNLFGTTNSAVPGPAATLTVIVPTPGTYASVVLSNSPYGYWRLDDNATTTDPTIYDNWGNNNGQAVDVASVNNMIFGVAGAPDVGFPTPHLAALIGNEFWTGPYRLNLPKLPGYSNTMTFAMWVKSGPDGGGCALMARNGYGNAYGLENVTYTVTNGVDITTNINHLQFDWGGGIVWDSGLIVPPNIWTFVALVVEPTQATIYMGTNMVSLTSAVSSTFFPPLFSSGENGDASTALSPLAVGRNPYPWADDGAGQPWASKPGTWSDVAVFYQSLTAQQIQDLFLAGVGLYLDGTPDGSGNLNLNWFPGATLQQADYVEGPYTDIGAATPPYSAPISTTGNKFYRLKK